MPGTTTACTPFRKSSSAGTHVADAITTRPVDRSTAMTDHVADADVETTSTNTIARNAARIRRSPSARGHERNRRTPAGVHRSLFDAAHRKARTREKRLDQVFARPSGAP